MNKYATVLKHLVSECKFTEAMRWEGVRDHRLVFGIHDKKLMSRLLTFDIAVAKYALAKLYKYVKLCKGENVKLK